MAIYHFSAKVIQRSKGRSVVAAAAYRSASELEDQRLGQSFDYQAKTGVVHSEILLPESAPERWQDRAVLWNEVEAIERRKDAVLAREVEFALPRELSQAEAVTLARTFVQAEFVNRGMMADLNVHWVKDGEGELQPHAHVLLSMRGVENGGFGAKRRDWNDVGLLRDWRARWAETANERLCDLGHDVRIDHRSLQAQGLNLEPQHKIGPAGMRRAERGEEAERLAQHRALARRNGEKLLAEPGMALQALTQQHSTFTRQDLARFLNRHTDGAAQFGAVLAKVSADPELVRVGVDERGRERLSTKTMLATEQRMEQAAAEIAGRQRHGVAATVAARTMVAAADAGLVLGEEQRQALRHVTAGSDLALVVGYAGSGKSAMLGVARAAWEASGYQVRGATLSGIAADGLQGGSGIASRTIASLEHAWARGRDKLGSHDVLVVDEAGMIGSRQMQRLLARAEAAGAKVVLVGDPEQLQAIEAGAAFRALAERHGAAEITAIRRQQVDWQRDATRELATGQTAAALQRYTDAGMVVAAATRDAAKTALVAGWEAARRAGPEESRIMLAYTRQDTRDLNQLARARMREAGALQGEDRIVETERGARALAAGDRILFLRNERALGAGVDGTGGVAVKNGTLGTLLAVTEGGDRLRVRLDHAGAPGAGASGPGAGQRGAVVTFSLGDYDALEHGYAATVHKAQGVTVDRVHLLATPHLDRHAAYVGLSRHRAGVALHYAREDFAGPEQLTRGLSRERAKDTSLDYDVPSGPARDADLIARYAERRGLVPDSEIVLSPAQAVQPAQPAQAMRQPAPQPAPEPTRMPDQPGEAVQPRRGRFAGLRLGASRDGGDRAAAREALIGPAPVSAPPLAATRGRVGPSGGTGEAELIQALAGYARAWADAARMTEQALPVLPHQTQALQRAGEALDGVQPGLRRDARAALQRAPGLAQTASTTAGVGVLRTEVAAQRQVRLRLEGQARTAVAEWGKLERAEAAADKARDAAARQAVRARMEAFAQALRRDTPVTALLHQRGRAMGVAAGSRLERVVQAREADLAQALRPDRSLSAGIRPSRGPSLER